MGTEVRNERLSYPEAFELLLSAGAVPAQDGIYQERRPIPNAALCRLCRDPECQAGVLAKRLFDAQRIAMDKQLLTPYVGVQLDLAQVAAELANKQCEAGQRGRLEFRGAAAASRGAA